MATFREALFKLWPNGDIKIPGLREAIAQTAPRVLEKYGLNNKLAMTHFMAQISHECGAGFDVEENLNYTAKRMTEVWPTRFPSIASAQPYAGNPRALANKVYNGRMGNALGSDDGWNYRGRGAVQTTGREAYSKLGSRLGLDLINHPDLVNRPDLFLEVGAADFVMCGCLPYALADDLFMVTKRLNGGTVGLASRREWYARWKAMNVELPVASRQEKPPVIELPQPSEAPTTRWEALVQLAKSLFSRGT